MKTALWILLLCLIAIYINLPIRDPDLWWHIVVGRWILHNRQVPTVDYWNMFGVGKPWRAYSWSVEVLFALVDGRFGADGLFFLQLVFSLILSFSFFYCLSRVSKDWFFGAMLGSIATTTCFAHFGLRPQTLSWVFLIWLLYAAECVSKDGFSAKRSLLIIFLTMAWANSHISTIIGLLLSAFWVIDPTHPRTSFKRSALIGLSCLIGTFLTPYLGGEWSTLFGQKYYSHAFFYSDIYEFQALTLLDYPAGMLLLLFVLFLSLLYQRPKTLSLHLIMLGGLLMLASLGLSKLFPYGVIVVSFLIAKLWGLKRSQIGELGNIAIGIKKAESFLLKSSNSFILGVVLILAVGLTWQKGLSEARVNGALASNAVDFIQAKHLPKPVLVTFGDGGYLMYRSSDPFGNVADLVAIDGRTNVVPKEVYKASADAINGRRTWKKYFDLVKPETVLWRNASPLVSILTAGAEWCQVYSDGKDLDEGMAVFIKRSLFETRRDEFKSDNCASH